MLIFAILSVPATVLFFTEKIDYKKIVLYFSGIVICQILSVVMWSLGTLYQYDNDVLITKALKYLINGFTPLMLMFIVAGIFTNNKSSNFRLDNFFIYGYLHWHLLFRLFYTEKFNNNSELVFLPFLYISSIYIYSSLNKLKFSSNSYMNKIIVLLFPILILLGVVCSIGSNILFILYIVSITAITFFLLRKFQVE